MTRRRASIIVHVLAAVLVGLTALHPNGISEQIVPGMATVESVLLLVCSVLLARYRELRTGFLETLDILTAVTMTGVILEATIDIPIALDAQVRAAVTPFEVSLVGASLAAVVCGFVVLRWCMRNPSETP